MFIRVFKACEQILIEYSFNTHLIQQREFKQIKTDKKINMKIIKIEITHLNEKIIRELIKYLIKNSIHFTIHEFIKIQIVDRGKIEEQGAPIHYRRHFGP